FTQSSNLRRHIGSQHKNADDIDEDSDMSEVGSNDDGMDIDSVATTSNTHGNVNEDASMESESAEDSVKSNLTAAADTPITAPCLVPQHSLCCSCSSCSSCGCQ